MLAFSIIMLNTDLHKATGESSTKAGRKSRRRSREEFVNNLKRAVPAEELPKEYISSIYDSIEAAPLILCAPNGSSLLSAANLAFKESQPLEKHASSGNNELNKVTSKYVKYSLEILRAMSLEESSFAVFG
ncbi:MAG: Sec7 domain-containing protein, partial [bacterium]